MNAIIVNTEDVVNERGFLSTSCFKIHDETTATFIDLPANILIADAVGELTKYHETHPNNVVSLYDFSIAVNTTIYGTYN